MSFSKIISENQIDQFLEQLERAEVVEATLLELEQLAPNYLAYVFSEDTKMLNAAEQELHTYIVAALWKCREAGDWEDANLEENNITQLEEKNWEKLEAVKGNFRKRLDLFYENWKQEDLLALVEDLLVTDEETEISSEGRDHIFILNKTFLDILVA